MVYSADSLDKVKAPYLKFGDEKAKRVFEEAYWKYCAKHDRVMRNRPPAHRILPKAVVECMGPDLLEYVCRRALPVPQGAPEKTSEYEPCHSERAGNP